MPILTIKNFRWYLLAVLGASVLFIWYAILKGSNNGQLEVSFLNIGQGDSIFIKAPNGNQMMIDGGPGRVVLGELGKVMPFYDRSIDLLLVTNPDKDHMAGFIDILNSFKIESVIEPGTKPDTAVYREFERAVATEQAKKIIARDGMRVMLDPETYFEIVFPDRDVSKLETNTGSIVGKLVYQNSCVVFPGDSPEGVETFLVARGDDLHCDVLKVGHHGSRTSTSERFLDAVTPRVAVISAGLHNSYGHPHKEVLDALAAHHVIVLGTYDQGRITLVSDGTHFSVAK
jgi:competence protein ComEC